MSYKIHKSKSQKSHYFYAPRRTTISKMDSSYIFKIQEAKTSLISSATSIDEEKSKKPIHLLGIK